MTVAVSSLNRTARLASLAHSTKLTLSDSLVSIAALEKDDQVLLLLTASANTQPLSKQVSINGG